MTRRLPFVLTAALAGLAVVLALRVGAPSSMLPVGSARASTDRQHHKSAVGGSAPPASAAGGSTTGGASSPGPSAPLVEVRRTAVGALENYGYGILSVRVTVLGSRIESVAVQRLQTAEQYSQQLAAQAIPMLHSEVLSAQSAQINGISGASYTSQAYALSLQSALDRLHVA